MKLVQAREWAQAYIKSLDGYQKGRSFEERLIDAYTAGWREEWKEQNLNRFTCSHEVFVGYEAWQQQQTRIDELESQLEDATMFHYKRGFQDAKEIHMRKNAGLLANIKVLEAQLEVADIRPTGESEYLERIETLEEQVEWHKRRAEGWRSIATLEEQGK